MAISDANMSSNKSIRILVTQGDPAGIGPEIVARAVDAWPRPEDCELSIVGYPAHFSSLALLSAIPFLTPPHPELNVIVTPAQPTLESSRAAVSCLEFAVAACLRGDADALCTAPIHKENLRAAGFSYPGHTEFLAARANVPEVAMMLAGGGLRVVLATIHEALSAVPDLLTRDKLVSLISLVHRSMKDFGFDSPKIGVAGLNPHAGEGGLFGREEIEIIAPAIADARSLGINVTGPHSADTLFHHQREGAFDVSIAMYHDQGLIPVKTLDFHGGVNITLGLSFVRTSPDHGTAYDLAGKNSAHIGSMLAALDSAYDLARRRRNRAAATGATT